MLSKVLTNSIFSYVNKVWHAYCKGDFENDSHYHRVFDFDFHYQFDLTRTKNTPKSVMCMYAYYGKFIDKKAF